MRQKNLKSHILYILTIIWLTGIIAPPVLQLIDDSAPIISINMNEEEPQEQGQKNTGEEVILEDFLSFIAFLEPGLVKLTFWDKRLQYIPYFGEIPFPPPEHFS
jgi:hypothetical protein